MKCLSEGLSLLLSVDRDYPNYTENLQFRSLVDSKHCFAAVQYLKAASWSWSGRDHRKRRLWGEFTAAFQYLRGSFKQEGDWHFTQSDSDRTRDNDSNPKDWRVRLDVTKKLFTHRDVRHWNRLASEAVDATFLEAFKAWLVGTLGQPDVVRGIPAHVIGL